MFTLCEPNVGQLIIPLPQVSLESPRTLLQETSLWRNLLPVQFSIQGFSHKGQQLRRGLGALVAIELMLGEEQSHRLGGSGLNTGELWRFERLAT